MSIMGNTIGAAIVAYRTAALAAFVAARRPGPYSTAELAQLALIQALAEGNAIVDNLPAAQAPAVSAVAFVSLQAGQPVYANGAGQVGLASAASYATSFVAGLAASDTAATFAANLTTDFLTQSNWAAITGTALLLPGRVYFLGLTPGTFTPIAPTTPGQLVVPVGQALSTTQFHVQINQPILL